MFHSNNFIISKNLSSQILHFLDLIQKIEHILKILWNVLSMEVNLFKKLWIILTFFFVIYASKRCRLICRPYWRVYIASLKIRFIFISYLIKTHQTIFAISLKDGSLVLFICGVRLLNNLHLMSKISLFGELI